MEYEKKFLIIGNGNAVTYKEIFPLIKENKIWMGVTMNGCQQSVFIVPNSTHDTNTKMRVCDGKEQYSTIINTAAWFTNIEHNKRHQSLDLYKKYSAEEYPKYDNYDAIEVSKVSEIPMGWDGVIGVPISFIGKYCPEQFEIVGGYNYSKDYEGNTWNAKINGKYVYKRILIRKKLNEQSEN